MKQDKRIIISIIWVIIGAVLVGFAFVGKVDEFWNGMGSTLLVIGILQIVRFSRFRKNPEYREKVETAASDERNHFIRNKAWAWAGYIFILIAAVFVIVLKVLGQETLSMAASVAICLMLVLYWCTYYILQRKY